MLAAFLTLLLAALIQDSAGGIKKEGWISSVSLTRNTEMSAGVLALPQAAIKCIITWWLKSDGASQITMIQCETCIDSKGLSQDFILYSSSKIYIEFVLFCQYLYN